MVLNFSTSSDLRLFLMHESYSVCLTIPFSLSRLSLPLTGAHPDHRAEQGIENGDEACGVGRATGSVKKRLNFGNANPNPFSSVRDLLATRFLEGAPVKYVFKKHGVELHGFIKDDGYECGCSTCNYTRVLSASEFEKHSGVTSSFANDHILLDNGISLNEVVKHLANAPLESLHEKLQDLTGCKIKSEVYDAWRKGLLQTRSPRQETKQIRASNELNKELPPSNLISQLNLDISFQRKGTRKARGNPRAPALPTEVSGIPLQTACPKRPHDCLSDTHNPVELSFKKKQCLSTSPTSDNLSNFSSQGSSSVLSAAAADSLVHNSELRNLHNIDSPRPQEREEQREASPAKDSPCKKAAEAKYAKALDVKGFLSTGLLEEFPVTYKFKKGNVMLPGIIKGCGYLCSCSSCKNSRVISALEFEKHAGASTSNQNDHIFLENGLSLYNLIKELKAVPLDSLGQVLEKRIGRGVNSKCYDLWKESYQVTGEGIQEIHMDSEQKQHVQQEVCNKSQSDRSSLDQITEGMASDSSLMPSSEESTDPPFGNMSDSSLTNRNHFVVDSPQEENKWSPQCLDLYNMPALTDPLQANTAIPDSSDKRPSLSPAKPYLPEYPVYPQQQNREAQGSLKKRDHYLHDLVFQENGLPDGIPLFYKSSGEIKLKGIKYEDGIVCSCCDELISPSKFEAHAGYGSRRQPYHNIYIPRGDSLHQFSVFLSGGESIRVHGEWCRVCGLKEDLIGCSGCTGAYHSGCLGCLGISIPRGSDKFCCPSCEKHRATSTGTTSKVDRQCLVRRTLEPPHHELDSCVLCKDNSFSLVKELNEKTVFLCYQCEKEYHHGCLKHHGICDLKEWTRWWFCSPDCYSIYAGLNKYVSDGSMTVPTFLLGIKEREIEDRSFINKAEANMQWHVLSGMHTPLQYKLMMEAIEVFREGFYYIVNHNQDIIPAMVYSRNIVQQDFQGMHCIVLTVKSVIVSAGILRIFGKDVAQLPLVATRKESRGKGYFRILLSLIEGLLSQLNVEILILPEAENALSMWTNKFGFVKMTDERVRKYANEVPLLMFQDTTILGKAIPRISSTLH